ncbi:MAG: tetratricopeptide repeat protein, partial [Planctomycetia bacterium]
TGNRFLDAMAKPFKRFGHSTDVDAARPAMARAEELFRQEKYSSAAASFKTIANRYKDTSVEEDALYWRAEALFKADYLPAAQDTYAQLLTKFPTTRHLPQAVQRTYDIAYYWLEDTRRESQGESPKNWWASRRVNFLDRTRPVFDTEGRAVEAIETIQRYDPFGPLTDDAVMMAGAQKFITDEYVQAAGFYEQVAIDQPKSEHATRSLILGGQAYLRAYSGPAYEGTDLENAEKLIKTALQRSATLTEDQKSHLESDLRLIHLERARRDFTIAEHYRRRGKDTSAKFYYELVQRQFPDTDWARRAETELRRIDGVEQREAPATFTGKVADAVPNLLPKWLTTSVESQSGATGLPSVLGQ